MQGDLFDPPRARRSDPLSSHEAADKVSRSGRARLQAQHALALVREYPGSTSKELAELSGMDRYALARRLPELEQGGLITRTSEGSKELRWWPKGLDAA